MKRLWIGAAMTLFLGSAGLADDPPKKADTPPPGQEKKEDPDSPMGKFKAARKAFTAAQSEFSQVYSDLKKKGEEPNTKKHPELAEAEKGYITTRDAMIAAGIAAAKADPKSPEALNALQTALGFGMGSRDFVKSVPEVIDILREHFIEHPKVGDLCNMLPTYTDETMKLVGPFLRAVMEKNPNKGSKGQATIALGKALLRTDKAEAEKLLEQVADEYKDVKSWRGTLAKEAEGHLFELRNLQVGMVAPDIEGEDVDGKKFKLSDYRGKVVMLDFWGHW